MSLCIKRRYLVGLNCTDNMDLREHVVACHMCPSCLLATTATERKRDVQESGVAWLRKTFVPEATGMEKNVWVRV